MSDLIPPMMPDDLDALIQAMERVQQLEAEVARLRLTDAEREAISRVYDLLCDRSRELQSATRLDEARPLIQWAKTLQGLWERLSGSAAISGAGKSAPAANTPPEPSPVCAGSHVALHRVVRALLDGVNARYAKNPREWTCPHMQTLDDMTQSEPQPTLTDEEREAVEYYIGTGGPDAVDATLRTLLERTK
jgi:hypothetical protein